MCASSNQFTSNSDSKTTLHILILLEVVLKSKRPQNIINREDKRKFKTSDQLH